DLLGFARRHGWAVLGLRQRTADDGGQFLEIEWLRQIFIGAALGGSYGRHERVLGAHDNDWQIRPHFLYARQEIERVLVGHHHIGDDQVALALTDPPP